MRVAEVVVALAALAVHPADRARYREQWLADLAGCEELDIPRWHVAAGALTTAATIAPTRGHTMKPIGPLAVVLRRTGASSGAAALLAAALASTLALGVGLLLLR